MPKQDTTCEACGEREGLPIRIVGETKTDDGRMRAKIVYSPQYTESHLCSICATVMNYETIAHKTNNP